MKGLLAWTPAMASASPSRWKDCRTVREFKDSFVAKNSGQVSLTQLNPNDSILFEIASMGCFESPSATTASKCDTQLTHLSFTLCPSSSTIHRESVCNGSPTAAWSHTAATQYKKINPFIDLLVSFIFNSTTGLGLFYNWKIGETPFTFVFYYY